MENINKKKIIKKVDATKTSNKFLNALFTETSKGRTENDAVTYTRSGSPLLDFFAQAGAMRANATAALDLFKKAFAENREKAIKILFYLRDVRGGQGERELFRTCLQWIGEHETQIFENIIEYIQEYGRWDDLFFDNPACFSLIQDQLEEDRNNKKPSLLAKWLPTINASSKTTQAKARFIAEKIGLTDIKYRKTIRGIRKQILSVEEQMSAKEWEDINYSHVPSQASRIYRNAFKKHDEERYEKFIEKAEKGEVKIQAGTLYPYQIYETVRDDYSKTLEALWNQLPDYTRGNNALVVADVSGSMSWANAKPMPMSVSVSLALYFAERNVGQFKDHFITFSGEPKLQKINGNTLLDKMNSIEKSDWGMNTDIQAVFNLILNTALKNSTDIEEMPETIYIISDMEFDECAEESTNYEVITEKYKAAGYKIPNIVFWNVNASGSNLPVQKNEAGVTLVSGCSPSIFKMVTENKSPEEVMLDIIDSERYSSITIE